MNEEETKGTLKTMKENIDKKYLKSRNSVAIETVLNLIQTQQAELEKKEAIINEMVKQLAKLREKRRGRLFYKSTYKCMRNKI